MSGSQLTIILESGKEGSVADLKKLSRGAVIKLAFKSKTEESESTVILGAFQSIYTCENCNPGSDCCIFFEVLDVNGPKIEWLTYSHDGFRHLSDFASIEILSGGAVVVEIIKKLCEEKHKLESRLARIEKRFAEFSSGFLV